MRTRAKVMRIKECREALDITQRELSARLSIIPSIVANWESEVALPRSRDLPALARALEVEISDLFVSDFSDDDDEEVS